MNLSTLRTTTRMARRAYGSYAGYRNRKAQQAYEALVEAANKADVHELIDESQKRFNTLSEKALDRIEAARKDINVEGAVEKASEKFAELTELGKKKEGGAEGECEVCSPEAGPEVCEVHGADGHWFWCGCRGLLCVVAEVCPRGVWYAAADRG